MRISELARTAGVPLATVKFYLREGLLPPGRSMSATLAEYDDTHVRRLRLIRALVDVGGLSLGAVRAVLAAVDLNHPGNLEALAVAHDALPPQDAGGDPPTRALDLVHSLGWLVDPSSSALRRVETTLAALAGTGMEPTAAHLAAYGQAALLQARADLDSLPRSDLTEIVEHVVTGTMLFEPLLLALRRIAQQHLFVLALTDGPGDPPAC